MSDGECIVEGISARGLCNVLEDREINGLGKRTVYDSSPVVVEDERIEY